MTTPLRLSSRDNPLLVRLRRLVQDGSAYRRGGLVWLEGEHLCEAAAACRVPVMQALLSDSGYERAGLRELASHAPRVAVVPDALMRQLGTLESPAPIGFVLDATARPTQPRGGSSSVVLDRVQDAGNVGSILRSAAALGVEQVIALKGTVALWSPKALRAGMGAHFALHLVEDQPPEVLDGLDVPLVATMPHAGVALHEAPLPEPMAWVFGHEGRGVDEAVLRRCALQLRIPQPGGQESLNVAAAAAICLYEASLGRGRRPGPRAVSTPADRA